MTLNRSFFLSMIVTVARFLIVRGKREIGRGESYSDGRGFLIAILCQRARYRSG